jgi:ribosomal protein S10
MDLFADFAMRAAYYLGLPAKGPVPLPRITERWTVPRSNFIFKKSQENFERITMRRLIQIQDGHPETVRLWLGVLQKYQYHGVGMKANVWEWESMDASSKLDAAIAKAKPELDKIWSGFGTRKESVLGQKIQDILASPEYGGALEVAKQEDEKQRAKMNAADEIRKLEEQEMEEEEFDKSFLMAYGPEALKAGRDSEKPPHTLRNEEDVKKEVERMNRILASLDSLGESELKMLREKWALREEEEEEEDYSIRSFEKILDAMGNQEAETPSDAKGAAEARHGVDTQDRMSEPSISSQKSKDK